MKAPFYEIDKDESFDDISKLVLNDKQSLHFVRRRNRFYEGQTLLRISDIETRKMFDDSNFKRLRTLNMGFHGWAKYWIYFQCMFLISLSVVIYWAVSGSMTNLNTEKLPTIIIFIALCCLLGFISIYLIVNYLRKYFFLKKAFFKLDDLYIIYDTNKLPCSIEVRGKQIRILYKQSLYIIYNKKIKQINNPLTIYCSYLNMFPQSALDIGKYITEHRAALSEKELAYQHPMVGTSYLANDCFTLSLTTYGVSSKEWRIYKYVFDLDKDNKLDIVYSAATESRRFRYYYVTRAEVVERGEIVYAELNKIINGNSYLKKLINEILE